MYNIISLLTQPDWAATLHGIQTKRVQCDLTYLETTYLLKRARVPSSPPSHHCSSQILIMGRPPLEHVHLCCGHNSYKLSAN